MTPAQAARTSPTDRYPACYIRESEGEDTDAAKEGQRIDCRTLATRDSIDPAHLIEFDDWQRSGSESAKRPAQDRLIADMKADRVSVVYARSMDRLMRTGAKATMDFLRLAEAHGVRIVTQREGELSASYLDENPSAWLGFATVAQFAEDESRVGRARARKAMATKRRNNSVIGGRPYGDLPGEDWRAVVAALREAGTLQGAARILNGTEDCQYCAGRHDRVPSRYSGRPRGGGVPIGWDASTVGRIIRHRIETNETDIALPARPKRGAWTFGTHYFTRLLVCPHDGATLTTQNRMRKDGAYAGAAYVCKVGHRAARDAHPRPWSVGEGIVMAWAREEVKRTGTIRFKGRDAKDVEHDLAELDEQKARAGRALVLGALTEAQVATIVDEIDAKRAEIDESGRARRVIQLGIDWSAPAAEVNARLRGLWRSILLGPDMRPIAADWIVSPVMDEAEADLRGYSSDELQAMGRRGDA